MREREDGAFPPRVINGFDLVAMDIHKLAAASPRLSAASHFFLSSFFSYILRSPRLFFCSSSRRVAAFFRFFYVLPLSRARSLAFPLSRASCTIFDCGEPGPFTYLYRSLLVFLYTILQRANSTDSRSIQIEAPPFFLPSSHTIPTINNAALLYIKLRARLCIAALYDLCPRAQIIGSARDNSKIFSDRSEKSETPLQTER